MGKIYELETGVSAISAGPYAPIHSTIKYLKGVAQ